MMNERKTILDNKLSDLVSEDAFVSMQMAHRVFDFFRQCPLFRWQDANNDCEDRANAACLLLNQWNIPCMKAWVFSGEFLQRDSGRLVNRWNYHVAASLLVRENEAFVFYVIDPAT